MAVLLPRRGDMRVRRCAALVALLLVAGLASAQTCHEYRSQPQGSSSWTAWLPTPQEACAASVELSAYSCGTLYDVVSKTGTAYESPAGSGIYRCWLEVQATKKSDGTPKTCTQSYPIAEQVADCPEEEDCGDLSGKWFLGVGAEPTNEVCNGALNCRAEKVAATCTPAEGSSDPDHRCVVTYEYNGDSCGGGDSEVSPSEDPEVCIGNFCVNEPNAKNCGWLNGGFVCLNDVADSGCKVFDDGSRVCGDSAPMPPVPDNGTAGVEAEPDDTFETDVGDRDYFDDETVAGSSRDPGGSGDNPYEEGDQGGDDGGGSGAVTVSVDGLTCEEGSGNCSENGAAGTGSDPREGWQCWSEGDGFAGAVSDCFEAASQSMWATIRDESPLLSVAAATVDAFPSGGGSCPSAPVVLAEETFDLWEVPCGFLAEVSGVLGPLFLLFWSFLGLRILLSIPGGE